MNKKGAIEAIRKHGALLVFPINNRKEPLSIWAHFFPRSEMKWEWDEEGDDRVADLWHLRTELSRSGKVVYTKWYQGRATFFSREVFTGLLRLLESAREPHAGLGEEARRILEVLEFDSPISTKELKRATDLRGRDLESTFQRGMKELWNRFLIVGFGEVEDGAFPSLAVGATRLIFEDLWEASLAISEEEARAIVGKKLVSGSKFAAYLEKALQAPKKPRFPRLLQKSLDDA
jgi:hypothetical protein